jgi:hypothetical protein
MKGARSKTNTMHSSYLPQEHDTTEQLNKPTSKPTTATQGQAGGRPTYFKRLSVDYKGETIHFTHFGGTAPSTDQYESYNGAGKMLGCKESYQGGPQNMMPRRPTKHDAPKKPPPRSDTMGGKLDTHHSPQHMGQGEIAVPIGSLTLHAHEINLTPTRGSPTASTKYNYAPEDNLTDFNNDTTASPYRMDD